MKTFGFVLLGVVIGVAGTTLATRRPTAPDLRTTKPDRFRWKGTEVSASPNVNPDPVIVAAFNADPPAPKERESRFAFIHPPTKIVGWSGAPSSVLALVGDGWEVELAVRPQLAGRANVMFTPATSIETWHVSSAGRLDFRGLRPAGNQFLLGD